ncbi:MarR family winged helix-turn-helix transcriptional regulator [Rarobacter incanus]|uniref:DNA-binding MarR family transcriptional regulator n=1 Tax=Rarobacter incanus TaxID=153494 RepID=A0A542SQL1_9MICO|nr:MarR family transcriptional regulator [Rarobacter incanus]TQK76892.1 DNA-binding MarR family transcriptional regulator [Rarobacter incanus]
MSASPPVASEFPPAALIELLRDLGVILRRGRHITQRAIHAVDPRLDPSAFPLLSFLKRNPGAMFSELAGAQGVSKGTMSRQVARLESFGLIERGPDENDCRSVRLSLTPAALELVGAVRTEQLEILGAALADWGPDDVASFAAGLHRFAESVTAWENSSK